MAKIKKLTQNEQDIYPVTHISAIIGRDGKTLRSELDNIDEDFLKAIDYNGMTAEIDENFNSRLNDVEGRLSDTNAKINIVKSDIDDLQGKLYDEFKDIEDYRLMNNTIQGYVLNPEIHGATIQNGNNLSDIKHTSGKIIDGMYEVKILSRNKNLIETDLRAGSIDDATGSFVPSEGDITVISNVEYTKINDITLYTLSSNINCSKLYFYDNEGVYLGNIPIAVPANEISFTPLPNSAYIRMSWNHDSIDTITDVQLEAGAKTEYIEPLALEYSIILKHPLAGINGVNEKLCVTPDGRNVHVRKFGRITRDDIVSYTVESFDLPNTVRVILNTNMTFKFNGEGMGSVLPFIKNGGDVPHCEISDSRLTIFIDKAILSSVDIDGISKYINDFKGYILAELETPIEEILPYHQTLRIRTFEGDTSIDFIDIPVLGSITGQIPCSLKSAVDVNTETVNGLIKKIESIDTMENGVRCNIEFSDKELLLPDVKSGYISNVAVKGKTLMNMANMASSVTITNSASYYTETVVCNMSEIKLNTHYTLFVYKTYLENHNYQNFKIFEVLGSSNTVSTNIGVNINGRTTSTFKYNDENYEELKIDLVFTDTKNMDYLTFRPCRRTTTPVDNEFANCTIKWVLIEGETGDTSPKYFEGFRSISDSVVKDLTIEVENKDTGSIDVESLVYVDEDNNWKLPELRGINGVHDLYYSDGNEGYKYLKRCESYKFSGEEDTITINVDLEGQTSCIKFNIPKTIVSNANFKVSSLLCDKFIVVNYTNANQDKEFITVNELGDIVLSIKRSKLSTADVTSLLSLLANWNTNNSPLELIYELAQPIEFTAMNINTPIDKGSNKISIIGSEIYPDVSFDLTQGLFDTLTILKEDLIAITNITNETRIIMENERIRISNENTRIIQESSRVNAEIDREQTHNDRMNDVSTGITSMQTTTSQAMADLEAGWDALVAGVVASEETIKVEVIDARDTHATLGARLRAIDKTIENIDQLIKPIFGDFEG